MLVYIGTYTGGKSQGIYASRFNPANGALAAPELAFKTTNPSFLALHPKRNFLYAVGETSGSGARKSGSVSAFSRDPATGKLQLLNEVSSAGTSPCHLALDSTGRCLLVANYGNGTVASFSVQEDGRLGEARTIIQHEGSSVNRQRQQGPHAHHVVTDRGNRHALVCDLGLDKVMIYRLDAIQGALTANDPTHGSVPAGAGPRHLAFDPGGRRAYVINEMGSSITAFKYQPRRGALEEIQTLSTLPEGFSKASSCAEVQVHPSGKFVYGSNRGHDSIAVFGVDSKDGSLTPVQHQSTQGKTPRHFAIDPSGRWLLAENQDSDNITIFSLDAKTGRLTPTGRSVEVGAPVCLVFAAAE
jgi:6-phosphogluconolactonase